MIPYTALSATAPFRKSQACDHDRNCISLLPERFVSGRQSISFEINATHDPALRSWLESANASGCDFPIQNLPFGRFSRGPGHEGVGVALGDCVIDLAMLSDLFGASAEAVCGSSLIPVIELASPAFATLRATLSRLYGNESRLDAARAVAALVPMAEVELLLPAKPPSFADFCGSIDHIRRMGAVTGKAMALCADRLPVGYNGRASSVVVSGTRVTRPMGQFEASPGIGEVIFGAEPMLDYELELGAWLRGGNALATPISVADAEAMIFGCCLVNDWSARGIQFFESMLGPHLGKSFLTSVSPWIVTMEALAPFRTKARGRENGEPEVPAYLFDEKDRSSGGIRIEMTATLNSPDVEPVEIVRTGFETMFWTLAQMVAHQASSGAPLEAADLLASGTVSGPTDHARACLAEVTGGGAYPISLPDGSHRVWLEDGDTISLSAHARAEGFIPIGFGTCSGVISPAAER